jgi:hypothetical protein
MDYTDPKGIACHEKPGIVNTAEGKPMSWHVDDRVAKGV